MLSFMYIPIYINAYFELFSFWDDNYYLSLSIPTVLVKGHSHSPCYRFMARSGDWVWVRSKSCVTYDAITHLPNGLSIYTWIVR